MPRKPRTVDFFRVWSPEMAYVLGYWWADGCMYIKPSTTAHEVKFASKDRSHLELIAQTIGESQHTRPVTKDSDCYDMTYCSKEMYYDLLALGGTPHKSHTTTMPAIPADQLPHFVRGCVDGDGTLVWNGDRPVIQIYSASSALLSGLGQTIEAATGIPTPTIVANRTLYYIKWSTIRAKCLAAWLYAENPGLALDRKAAIAAKFLDWQPKKRPERGTITEGMRARFGAYLPPQE
ncbi:MAG: hypothetical protein HGA65_18045 [Oscillochloris sp.]|nr:hypothetical protein [Oscillochloris sp.]